jgi:exonuclease III
MRVASFNLNNKLAQPRQRHKIVQLLLFVNADVLCLQEIMKQSHVRWLAQQLNMHAGKWHRGGMVVLSKQVITKSCRFEWKTTYCNGLVGAQTHNMWFFSIHLDSRQYKKCEDKRVHEMQLLSKLLSSPLFKRKSVVIAGDWNSPSHLDRLISKTKIPKSSCVPCRFATHKTRYLPSSVMQSCNFIDMHDHKKKCSTWIPALEQRKKPIERIDRMYIRSKQFKVLKSRILTPSFYKKKTNCLWPTGKDHCLIWCVVK